MSPELIKPKTLPENAYKRLPEGELDLPIVSASPQSPEHTAHSIFWGILFGVIFAVPPSRSTLKVGQGMVATIIISILGLARLYQRRSSRLENMLITRKGNASAVLSGDDFTVPQLCSGGASRTTRKLSTN